MDIRTNTLTHSRNVMEVANRLQEEVMGTLHSLFAVVITQRKATATVCRHREMMVVCMMPREFGTALLLVSALA